MFLINIKTLQDAQPLKRADTNQGNKFFNPSYCFQKYSFFNDFVYFHHVHLWFLWSVLCGTMPHKKSHGIEQQCFTFQHHGYFSPSAGFPGFFQKKISWPESSMCLKWRSCASLEIALNLCLTNASKSMRPALNFTPMSALHQCAPMCNNVNTALYNLCAPVCVCVLVCLYVCECVRVCVLSSLELLALVQPGCSTHLGFFQS